MKDLLGILRLGAYLFALPLVATAAASAHQWAASNTSLEVSQQIQPSETVERVGVAKPVLQDHIVGKNEAGEVVGQVAIYNPSQLRKGLRNLTIYFVQGGKIIEETRTDRDGGFKAAGLKDGNYSLIAVGDSGFAVVGLDVVSEQAADGTVFELTAATPAFNTIKKTLADFSTGASTEGAPSNVSGTGQAKNDVGASSRVWLNADGQLKGRVISLTQSLAGKTSISLIQNDELVASVSASKDGSFQVNGLEPGVYDMVAIGPSGLSVISIQAVPEGAVNGVYTSLNTFHSSAIAPTADLVLADVGDSTIVKKAIEFYTQIESGADEITYESSPSAVGAVADNMCMATACGCDMGGAGGGQGGLGIGAAALVAAVAIPLGVSRGSNGGGSGSGGGPNPAISPSEL